MTNTKHLTNKTNKTNNTVTRMNSTKRPRAPIACIRCHHKKVRCDGLQPNCSRCTQSGVLCAYPSSRRSRNTQPSSVDLFTDNLSQLEIKIQQIEEDLKSQRHLFLSYQQINVDSSSPSLSSTINENYHLSSMNDSKKITSTHPHHQRDQTLVKCGKRSLQNNEANVETLSEKNKSRRKNKKISKSNPLNSNHNNHPHHSMKYTTYITNNDDNYLTYNNNNTFVHTNWSHPTSATTLPCSNPIFLHDQVPPPETFEMYSSYTDSNHHQQHNHYQHSPLTTSDYTTEDGHGDSSSSSPSSSSSSHMMYFNDSIYPVSYPQTPSLIPSTSESTTHSSISKSLNHIIPDPTLSSTPTPTMPNITITPNDDHVAVMPQSSCAVMDMYQFNMGNLMAFDSQPIGPIINSTGWY
ncbi:unnamed protein product [Cunninghamella blakesleeana]